MADTASPIIVLPPNAATADTRLASIKPPPSSQKLEVVVPIELKVDGKVLAKIVTTRQTKLAEMPLGVHGTPDGHGSFVGPGTTFQNA